MPRCRHKVIHRKRVTYELHDSYFHSMTIKRAIPKTAEVHIPMDSYGKWSWGRGGVSISPRGSLMVIKGRRIEQKAMKNSAVHASMSCRCPMCVFSAIVYLHRRVQASHTKDSNTSPDCSYFTQASVEKINIYCYIYYVLSFVWPERNVTLVSRPFKKYRSVNPTDSKRRLPTILANKANNILRVLDEIDISESHHRVVCNLHDLIKSIRWWRNVPHVAKIFENCWLFLVSWLWDYYN